MTRTQTNSDNSGLYYIAIALIIIAGLYFKTDWLVSLGAGLLLLPLIILAIVIVIIIIIILIFAIKSITDKL